MKNVDVETFVKHKECATGKNVSENYLNSGKNIN